MLCKGLREGMRQEGYTHDYCEAVLRCGWHLLASGTDLLDGAVQIIEVRGDVPLIY